MSNDHTEVSRREAEVLAAIGERLSNAEIAARLFISVRTVESHVSSLLRKFDVASRKELVEFAAQTPAEPVGIPAAWTTFIDRDRERGLIGAALADTRLVTLVGPGGVGKTRLAAVVATEAAPSFPSGIVFVDLVPVSAGFVVEAVAAALGLSETRNQPLHNVIAERVGVARTLLVLDNCEHLLAPVARFVARLLSACPNVRVLATSRERLGIAGERLMAIEPLPVESEAVTLFRHRAEAAGPGFDVDTAVVSRLCARLDGLPLAIELAAARSATLGTSGLLAAADDSPRLLTGGRGADQRHESLRAVLQWSHDLLDEEARVLFRRLAAFSGPFDLTAAVAISGGESERAAVADGLGRLADKSLIVHRPAAGRWRLLNTVRAFATDQLERSGEREEVLSRHAHWAAATAARLAEALGGGAWREEFDAVADDLRAALACREGTVGHQLARSMGRLAFARRFITESIDHFHTAAELAPTSEATVEDLIDAADVTFVFTFKPDGYHLLLAATEHARGNIRAVAFARAAEAAGRFFHFRDYGVDATPEAIERLLAEAEAAGDPDNPVVAASIAIGRAWNTRDLDSARAAATAARATGDAVLISAALDAAHLVFHFAGRYHEATRVTRERLALVPSLDRDAPRAMAEIVDILDMACSDALRTGDIPGAISAANQLLAEDLDGGNSHRAAGTLVPGLLLSGDLEAGLRQANRVWRLWQQAGSPLGGSPAAALAMTALAHVWQGDHQTFRLWRARAGEAAGGPDPSLTFADLRAAIHTGDHTNAAALVEEAFTDLLEVWALPYTRASAAELAAVAGLVDAAERIEAAAELTAHCQWATACLARANGRLNGDLDSLVTAAAIWERIGARIELAYTLLLIPDRAAEGRALLAELGIVEGRTTDGC